MNFDQLNNKIENSAFKKQRYSLATNLMSIPDKIRYYAERLDSTKTPELVTSDTLHLFVASFQRNSDHWNGEMQTKFIENIMLGCRTDITLYTTYQQGTNEDCKILDGQHRVLAILLFLEGKIKPFGFTFDELKSEKILWRHQHHEVYLNIVVFNNESEAIQFYIDINENITHSENDIQIAKKALETCLANS